MPDGSTLELELEGSSAKAGFFFFETKPTYLGNERDGFQAVDLILEFVCILLQGIESEPRT